MTRQHSEEGAYVNFDSLMHETHTCRGRQGLEDCIDAQVAVVGKDSAEA